MGWDGDRRVGVQEGVGGLVADDQRIRYHISTVPVKIKLEES